VFVHEHRLRKPSLYSPMVRRALWLEIDVSEFDANGR
jgi:hypothetical protein